MTVNLRPTRALKSLPGLAKCQKIVRRETFRLQNSRYLVEIIISLYNLSLIQISAEKFFNLFDEKEGGGENPISKNGPLSTLFKKNNYIVYIGV